MQGQRGKREGNELLLLLNGELASSLKFNSKRQLIAALMFECFVSLLMVLLRVLMNRLLPRKRINISARASAIKGSIAHAVCFCSAHYRKLNDSERNFQLINYQEKIFML
jgi:hypothetical protein